MKDVIIYIEETKIRYYYNFNYRSYEFTDSSLERLINSGISFDEAFKLLVDNTPTL